MGGILVRKLFHSRRFIRPEIHVVPVFQSKFLEIMEAFHRSLFSSLLGTRKMFERSGDQIWFSNIYAVGKMYCVTCETCLRRKALNLPRFSVSEFTNTVSNLRNVFLLIWLAPFWNQWGSIIMFWVMDYFSRHLHLIFLVDAKAGTF